MTTTTILVVSAIASAFLLFGGMLAWADFYTRGMRSNRTAPPDQVTLSVTTDVTEYREAA